MHATEKSGSRLSKYGCWSIIAVANISALVYILKRYTKVSDDSLWFYLLLFATFAFSWLVGFFATWTANKKNVSLVVLICCAVMVIACGLFFAAALEKRFMTNLVTLSSVTDSAVEYLVWTETGECAREPLSLPLARLHRMGDETAHLASAEAIRVSHGNPAVIRELVKQPSKRGPSYWIRRALAGHPPGLAILFAPICTSPPAARVWAFLLFLLAAAMAWWAGNQWSRSTQFGLLCAACFAFVPNLNWWHMTSVSSDIPPCIFTFWGFGVLGYSLVSDQHQRGQIRRDLVAAAGILFGLGTFVTFTGALATLSAVILLWAYANLERRRWASFALLLLPTIFAVFVGIAYSKFAIPSATPVLLDRVNAVISDTSVGSSYSSPLKAAIIFVSRWPMDLGSALTVLFVLVPCWLLFVRRKGTLLERGKVLIAALAVLVPSATFFWPEIRFAYPGWLAILIGLGLRDFWDELNLIQRCCLISAIVSFGFSKYVLHALLVQT